ncbi:NAD dependent epimerase/dehydratase [Ophiobolus disseminans]|uniref:NAD dependent epimerase/dehydratase n=1 Tax=Ophiobolus disseminans TaxID=1469910 RepID=A0A6A7AKU1_9PLEO|nr:NAD dependent epimerase/dehydratase [Ophiobolus disseminans]
MSTIFITGASGYIGTVLTTLALAQGHTVTALSRSTTSDAKLSSLGAIPVRGDITTLDVLTREAAKANITINIADAIAGNFNISDTDRKETNNAALLALAQGIQGTTKKLVLTSGTLHAGAHPNGAETNEDSPAWPDAPFGAGLESLYPDLKARGLNVNVVRLGPWVYGRGGSGVKLFMSGAAQTGVLGYVGDGAKRTTTIHVDDAARLYLLVATKAPGGEIYNATSETNITFKQLAEAMGKVLGVKVESVEYEDMAGKAGPFLAKFLSLENRGSAEKARRELGWKVEAEKGILDEIETGSYVQLAEELKAGMAKA